MREHPKPANQRGQKNMYNNVSAKDAGPILSPVSLPALGGGLSNNSTPYSVLFVHCFSSSSNYRSFYCEVIGIYSSERQLPKDL